MSTSNQYPLIPRNVLFGNPDKASPRISPDGQKLAFLAPVNGVLNIWVGVLGKTDTAKPITKDTNRGIQVFFWSYTNQHIVYLQDIEGDENWRVYSVNTDTGLIRNLTPIDNVHATIAAVSHKHPNEIVVGLNDRDPQLHDLYLINIQTGKRNLILKNDSFAGFVLDDSYNVRFGMRLTPDGGNEIMAPAENNGWEPFMKIGVDDALTTNIVGFDASGQVIYLIDSRERDTAAFVSLNLITGASNVFAENPDSDTSDVMMHPVTKDVEAVAFTHQRKKWQVLSDRVSKDLKVLAAVSEGEIEVVSRSLDDSIWIVAYLIDDGPVQYFLYTRDQYGAFGEHPTFLFTNKKDLETVRLSKMQSVVIPSRDGYDLVCYYTLPAWTESKHNNRPAEPLPTVLLVHGGPWARDDWGYDPMHQWLANRGYAVLSVNFRGSTGLGKEFINSGNREWGAKMQYDLIDAINWAVENGISDRDKIAIMGGSYGGYATLIGITTTPEMFACGVDIVGPSSLITLMESLPPYWQPMIDLFTVRVGDHKTDDGRAFLNERSPLSYVNNIKRPLLIAQGANDPRVKESESSQIVTAMKERGIPVTYVLYSDEGHGFARPENRLSFSMITEAFLAEHLGGRCEPLNNAFENSTVAIPEGSEHIPGLTDALKTINGKKTE